MGTGNSDFRRQSAEEEHITFGGTLRLRSEEKLYCVGVLDKQKEKKKERASSRQSSQVDVTSFRAFEKKFCVTGVRPF